MTKLYILIIGLLVLSCKEKQDQKEFPDSKKLSYQSFYDSQKTKVLVVGTFHFDYPGLDKVKTAENDKIDVLKDPKNKEIEELVDYIKRFRPTKVGIEAFPSWKTNEKYNLYKEGLKNNERDERYQLGMRIAKDLNIDKVHPIDAGSLVNDLYRSDSVYAATLFNKVDWEITDPFWEKAENAFTYDDQLVKEKSLLDYFKRLNSREGHNFNLGLYFTGNFETGDGQGADYLSTWWYNRNLRIFRNIQQITDSPQDRVLVIIGNGHASILRHMYEASPEFEFVEFSSL